MKIKNMIMAGLVCCGITAAFTSCSKDTEAFYTVSADDAPRILNDDLKSTYEFFHTDPFTMQILVTPAEMTTIKWYDNKELITEGHSINHTFETGEYKLRIVGTTVNGKETMRTVTLKVKNLDGEPVATSSALEERMLEAGQTATLTGANLASVKKVSIGGREVDAVVNADGNALTYVVPADMTDGAYRVSLIDANNNSFGADKVTVVTKTTINGIDIDGLLDGGNVTVVGTGLDKVATVSVAGTEYPIVSKSNGSLTFSMPAMEVGNYEMKATTEDGKTVQFYNDETFVETGNYVVTLEKTILKGDFVIDWNEGICHLTKAQLEEIPVGAKIFIYYEVPDAEYHALRIITNWWNDVPGGAQIAIETGVTPNPYVLDYTQAFHDMVMEQDGMSCVGFGYTVKKITYKE